MITLTDTAENGIKTHRLTVTLQEKNVCGICPRCDQISSKHHSAAQKQQLGFVGGKIVQLKPFITLAFMLNDHVDPKYAFTWFVIANHSQKLP